jgi:hypothetical protein
MSHLYFSNFTLKILIGSSFYLDIRKLLDNWNNLPLQTSMISKIKYKASMFRVHKSWGKGNGGRVTGKKF